MGVLGLGFCGWGLRGARRDGEGVGEMCGGVVGSLWNVWESEGNGYGLWGRGSEKGRSWFWNYALCLAKLGPNGGEL